MAWEVIATVNADQFGWQPVTGAYAKRKNAEREQIVRQYHEPGKVFRIRDTETGEISAPRPGKHWA